MTAPLPPGAWEVLDEYQAALLNETPSRVEDIVEIGDREEGLTVGYLCSDNLIVRAAPVMHNDIKDFMAGLAECTSGDEAAKLARDFGARWKPLLEALS